MNKEMRSCALALGAILLGGFLLAAGWAVGAALALAGFDYLAYLRFCGRSCATLAVLAAANAALCVYAFVKELPGWVGIGALAVLLAAGGLYVWFRGKKTGGTGELLD